MRALLIFFVLCTSLSISAGDTGEQAAQRWLALVDTGNYSGSWGQTAIIFQKQVSSPEWAAALNKVRTPLGKVLSRKVSSSSRRSSLPGAPNGQYLIVHLNTDFEKKPKAIETVTLAKAGSHWRIAGYFVK